MDQVDLLKDGLSLKSTERWYSLDNLEFKAVSIQFHSVRRFHPVKTQVLQKKLLEKHSQK